MYIRLKPEIIQAFIIAFISATWPEGVRRIANDYMDNPLQVYVGTLDLAACHSVTQIVKIVGEDEKRQRVSTSHTPPSISLYGSIFLFQFEFF